MKVKRDRIWRNVLGATFLSLMVVLNACNNDDDLGLDVFDEDEAFAEFDATPFFDDRDFDNDNVFNDTEFNQSFFDSFDLDRDGFIEEDELNTSRTDFRASTAARFNDLDVNADARLDMTEFETDFESNDFFNDFDADVNTTVTPREFSDGVFTRFDEDNDGLVESSVFETRFDRHFF
jgi:Ca2+-binding EF-hand superfamily protein